MKRIAVFVLVMLLVLSTVSCACGKKAQEKKAEALAEEMLESQLGEDVDVDIDGDDSVTIKTEDGDVVLESSSSTKWPEDMPSDVPEIKGVNFVGSFNMNGALSVTFEGCDENKAKEYKSLLEKEGYEILMEMNNDGGYMLMAQKGNATVNLTWSPDTDEGSITYMTE